MPCRLEKCTCKADKLPMKSRVICPHWVPSQGSKYYTCELFELERQPCPFEDRNGKSPCETCEYNGKLDRRGRPNLTGVDWNNSDSVNQYRREKYRDAKH